MFKVNQTLKKLLEKLDSEEGFVPNIQEPRRRKTTKYHIEEDSDDDDMYETTVVLEQNAVGENEVVVFNPRLVVKQEGFKRDNFTQFLYNLRPPK